MKEIVIQKSLPGMWVDSYVTVTETDEGTVLYGPFATSEVAYEWAEKLINATVSPVYAPAYNRG